MGVQLFFVLSGYLAFYSFDNNPSAKDYYKKRIVRIVPLYWFCLILLYFMNLTFGCYETSLLETLSNKCSPHFLIYFAFLQCFIPSKNWWLWNNMSGLWTMSSFVGFYLLVPFLYKLMKKFYPALIILIIVIVLREKCVNLIKFSLSSFPTEARIASFAASNPLTEMYCFLLGSVIFTAIKENKLALYLLLVSATMVLTSLSRYQYEFLFVLIISIAVMIKPITENTKICDVVSKISGGTFALYLIHPLVLEVANTIWGKLGIDSKIIHTIVLYFSSIAVSYFLYYFVVVKIEKRVKEKIFPNPN